MSEPYEHVDRLQEACTLLAEGYSEKAEYKVEVTYHRGGPSACKYHGKSTQPKDDCECPVVIESRVRHSRKPGLLNQLSDYQRHKDVDRNAKAARGAPRVKTPKMHPELAGFLALDEITCDIYMTVDRALEEAERDRTWAASKTSVVMLVRELPGQVMHWAEARPDLARSLAIAAEGWVRRARQCLKISVGDSIFDGVVCGNCGGGLATAHDDHGDMRDVRCVGTPSEAPCGESYPMAEWIKLYEGRS